ncbi:NAD(P)/FAD-dependent oxidoreductase [Prosthecomicrobium hirschii]|uniref:NAD(P)/FAD-dependent oxidoreductase n=1 Tax=Prosthecodimorpha hirschii TaxID=665126 RepID=UPI00221FBA6A|nr:FAD-binding oxidoreductase [Prosthecomicrobium hirschii]MCW1841970.1 FAD-binding oxidoreductase [Prosthecomicrobium hirschii]
MYPALFHPQVYETDVLPRTIWSEGVALPVPNRLGTSIRTEVAVIGGGYAGLSAALHLARDYGIEAVVLDAAPIGWGASARNGGFVTLPAAKASAEEIIARYGEADAYGFFRSQADAIELVRRLLTEERIEAEPQGDATYDVAHAPSAVAGLQRTAEIYRHRFGLDAAFLGRWAFDQIGHGGTEQHGALRLRGGFGLNPLKFLLGLEAAARRHGAVVHADSPVLSWAKDRGRHILETPDGQVSARSVIVATNGYTPDDLQPALANRTIPALSNIVVTRPLTEDELAAEGWRTVCPVANTRSLLFYYRLLPDRRFLFGARGGTSGSPREDKAMRAWLERRLGEVFPSWKGIETTHFWNGLVCLTARRTPAIGRLPSDPTVLYGFGWHGNGVNTAPWAGQVLAHAVAMRSGGMLDLPAPYRGLPMNLFAPSVRKLALKAAYLWYGLTERS